MATLPEVSILPIPNRRGCCTSRLRNFRVLVFAPFCPRPRSPCRARDAGRSHAVLDLGVEKHGEARGELDGDGTSDQRRHRAQGVGETGLSRQSNRKAEEGSKHPDRNAQFEHINAKVIAAQARHQPVLSAVICPMARTTKSMRGPAPKWPAGRSGGRRSAPARCVRSRVIKPSRHQVIPFPQRADRRVLDCPRSASGGRFFLEDQCDSLRPSLFRASRCLAAIPSALLAGAQPEGKCLARNPCENLQELRPQIHRRRSGQARAGHPLISNTTQTSSNPSLDSHTSIKSL